MGPLIIWETVDVRFKDTAKKKGTGAIEGRGAPVQKEGTCGCLNNRAVFLNSRQMSKEGKDLICLSPIIETTFEEEMTEGCSNYENAPGQSKQFLRCAVCNPNICSGFA